MGEQRLIDAEHFKQRVMPKCKFPASLECEVDSEPTVDAMMVVHAHWVGLCGEHILPNTNGKVLSACNCSHCGEYLDGSDEYIVNGKFCPSCGARMDEPFGKTEQLGDGDSDDET